MMNKVFKHVEVTVVLKGGETLSGIAYEDPSKCGKFWTIFPEENQRDTYSMCQVSEILKVDVNVVYHDAPTQPLEGQNNHDSTV
ncbi:hypothetical protein [Vibrio paucivorans]|uniref:Uncharacterized protein n=1 Tax=Vibrio paucivorans TaxID=2829489 RepID=A0A9X3CIE6_9VIBR|nr:hypothetical protein [Vibrio paucivorans]MCW8336382.1 hypothetical protein [Vibrio paucivorans]